MYAQLCAYIAQVRVVGLVAEGSRLVPAAEAGKLLRYGYKT